MNIGTVVITISFILIAVFIALTIFFFRKAKKIRTSVLGRAGKTPAAKPEIVSEYWQAVLDHLNSANESEWKLAIIEADKLANDLLLQKGYKGESMAERMSLLTKEELQSLDLLWEAHKVRNRIAHKLDFKISRSEALRVISYYEEALKELLSLDTGSF
ncbi:MAG: hypothetical protein HYS78_01550 [Parcubacteria group bacterium]|nr:hypothetical protein [Parcubacteria group bacterium]